MLEGGQFVHSEVGFNADALAWYAADQALRMMTGQPSVANVAFPYQRMFTPDNIGEPRPHPGRREDRRVVRLDRLPGRLHEAVGPELNPALPRCSRRSPASAAAPLPPPGDPPCVT